MIPDFYSKLTEQEKKIFYVTLVIVLLMLVDRIFLGPALSKMRAYDQEIEEQKKNIQQDLRFLTYKERILNDDEALSPYYRNKYKTEDEVLASFLKKIEMIATEAKINLIKVSPAETKERKGYKEYYANLECEGLLENIASFMHAVDTSQDLLKIIKVNFSLKRASGDEVLVGMVVSKMFMGGDLIGSHVQPSTQSQATSEASQGLNSGSSQKQSGENQAVSGSTGGGGGGGQKKSAVNPSTSGSAGGGGGASASKKAEEPSINIPQGQQSQNVSQRYQMKGFKPSEKDLKALETAPPPEDLKPSIFEKIIEKADQRLGAPKMEDEPIVEEEEE